MHNKNKKIMVVLLAVIALTLVFALVMSACEKQPEDTGDDVTVDDGGNGDTPSGDNGNNQTGDGGNGQSEPEPVIPTIDVSFNKAMTFTMEDVSDLSDYLNVNYAEGSDSRNVGFRVNSSKLSDDGLFIEVVVAAEGLEKTVLLPCASEDEALIRTELRPLYTTLKKNSDQKAFTFKIVGTYMPESGSEPMTFNLKAVVNLLDRKGDMDFSFALYSEDGDEEKVFLLYEGGNLNIAGMPVDINKFMPLVNFFLGKEEEEEDLPLFATEAPATEGENVAGEEAVEENDDEQDNSMLFGAFTMLSRALNKIDEIRGNQFLKYLNLINKANGGYVAQCDSGMLTGIVSILRSLEMYNVDIDFDLNSVVDFVDEITGGAFKSGHILFGASFGFVDSSVEAEVHVANDITGMLASIAIELGTVNESIELPDISGQEPFDIEITVPFALPMNNVDLLVDVTIHTSDMFAAAGRDYVTATVTYNQQENPIFTIVLNDNYAYADANGWAKLYYDKANGFVYYNAFKKKGQVVSFIEYLPILLGLVDPSTYVYPYGFGCEIKDGYDKVVTIGTTEAELRERLFAYYVNEKGEKVEVSDYVIEDFDSTLSGYCTVKIILADDCEKTVYIVVRDPADTISESIDFTHLYIALGTEVEDVENAISLTLQYKAGNVYWYERINGGFEITQIIYQGSTYVTGFDSVGNYTVYVLYDDKSGTINADVYDPNNLIVKDIFTPYRVYLRSDATEEDIRNQISVKVGYDDNSCVDVDDYIIEGYENGVDEFKVVYGDKWRIVHVEYDDSDWTSFFRFDLKKDDEIDVWGIVKAIKDICSNNAELFGKVLTYEVDESGKHLCVALNIEEDEDCLAILNLFIGMPGEDGDLIDLSDEVLLVLIEEIGEDIPGMFNAIFGVELDKFISPLYFKLDIGSGEGISVTFELCDGAENSYFVTGFNIKKIAPAPQFVLPESLENAKSFVDFGEDISDLFMCIFDSSEEYK